MLGMSPEVCEVRVSCTLPTVTELCFAPGSRCGGAAPFGKGCNAKGIETTLGGTRADQGIHIPVSGGAMHIAVVTTLCCYGCPHVDAI